MSWHFHSIKTLQQPVTLKCNNLFTPTTLCLAGWCDQGFGFHPATGLIGDLTTTITPVWSIKVGLNLHYPAKQRVCVWKSYWTAVTKKSSVAAHGVCLCNPLPPCPACVPREGAEAVGGPSGVSQSGMEAGGWGGEAEASELLPVSVGSGPGECSVCWGLMGASFPASAPCRLIGETWRKSGITWTLSEADRISNLQCSLSQLRNDNMQPFSLCNETWALHHWVEAV